MANKVVIDGVTYVQESEQGPRGPRCVVVVDRGWIFAGDVTEEAGRIRIDRAVWVFRWEAVGFTGVLADPSKADIRPVPTGRVDLPLGAEVFRVPVPETWGVK